MSKEMSPEAHELILHGDNTEQLHRSSHMPIIKNLMRKKAKGVYDHEKAKTLWKYHADRAAQSYTKEHGHPSMKWHETFSPEHRKQAAEHWADRENDSMNSGEYSHVNLKRGVHENMNEEDDVLDTKAYALEIAKATIEDRPNDAAQAFDSALRSRVADIIAGYREAVTQDGFGTVQEPDDEYDWEDEVPEDEEDGEEVAEGKGLYRKQRKDKGKEKTKEIEEADHWISGAIKHPGRERRAAARAGESTHEYEEKHKDAPGSAGKAAQLGLRLAKMRKR